MLDTILASKTIHSDVNSSSLLSNSWLNPENSPLPTARQQIALHSEPEHLDLSRHHIGTATELFPDWQNRETRANQVAGLQVSSAQKFKAKHKRDALTGLEAGQAIVSGQGRHSLAGSWFDSASGYGLVNAAKAVAWSAGYYPRSLVEVADLGGYNWNNDMVKAPEAWAQGVRGQGVTVAVIDSGVDINHPDLNDNIWRNTREIAGDGIDNDANGYVDDIFGWNFGRYQNNNDVRPGTNDPSQGHGTHVAGTIAAEANGFGTTGVAPNAKIMALRLGDVRGGRFVNGGDLAEAIRYAVNNGARVINMSLGWAETPELISALAYAASRNVITISSSGNEFQSSPGAPAKYATHYGISVGAVDAASRKADFSNGAGYDSRMQHVMAPGVEVRSTVPNGKHGIDSGTSMAAPHVAGVVALMLSVNPNLTHAQIRYILTQSATSLGYSSGFNSSSFGTDNRSAKIAGRSSQNSQAKSIDFEPGMLV